MNETIGFIGLGIMGQGMVKNLLKAGFTINIWNRTSSRMEPLIAAGAIACANPADVAARSDIIITVVSDTPDVEAVILGENGVINGAKEGSLVIGLEDIPDEVLKTIKVHGVESLDEVLTLALRGSVSKPRARPKKVKAKSKPATAKQLAH